MKFNFPSRILILIPGVLLSSPFAISQNQIQVFPAINTRQSPNIASFTVPYVMASSTVNVTCPAVAKGTLSGPLMNANNSGPLLSSGNLQPGGNLFVDNNVIVTVTPFVGPAGTATNVCVGGVMDDPSGPAGGPNLTNSCFNQPYRDNLGNGIIGKNPDTNAVISVDGPATPQTLDFFGGVAPIPIDSYLAAADGQTANITIALWDEGGYLASSSIFFTTNCTINGVSAGVIGGNPMNGPDSDSQNFTFNPNTGGLKGVQFQYDVTGSVLVQNTTGAAPNVTDITIDPSTFQSLYVPGTSFATSNCFIHDGEVLKGIATHPCKIYQLKCLDPNGDTIAGANCPISNQVNEVVRDVFDGPQFKIYDIHGKNGGVIHEGIGFLMASDTWPDGGTDPSKTNCKFDPLSGPTANLPCPQNLLTSFTGPGGFSGSGEMSNPNSTFISVYGVPEDKTDVEIDGQRNGWVNTRTPTLEFESHAPDLTPDSKGNLPYIMVGNTKTPVPGGSQYVPQPIKSITYGISALGNLPNPVSEPIAGDVTLVNPNANCAPGRLTQLTVPDFEVSDTVSGGSALSDGLYIVHYFAQDCAGTQELFFHMPPGTGVWSTNFYTVQLNVDATKPVVYVNSPLNTPTFAKNSVQYVSYYCTDAGFVPGGPNTGSGVTTCGTHSYGAGSTYNTGTVTTQLNTSTIGNNKSFTVNATDGAGNQAIPVVVYYNVQ